MLEKYNELIQDQLAQRITEQVVDESKGREFDIPYNAVERDEADVAVFFEKHSNINNSLKSQYNNRRNE